MKYLLTFIFTISLAFQIEAQSFRNILIEGKVTDASSGNTIEYVTIYIKGTNKTSETNDKGVYGLKTNVDYGATLIFTRIGYKEASVDLTDLADNQRRRVDIELVPQGLDLEIIVTESKIEDVAMVRESVEEMKLLPSTSGNFESILPHLALGTRSGTGGELSSQYNVRGGNYDENLVYVNDFEIFRPQLIRSSQQEGLSFPNIDLIRDLSFSSGGFESKFGDKLSSVLDIRYKRPEEFKASASMSFLGASAHVEGSKILGSNTFNKLRYLIGARYKTTKYLLGSLDVTGEYAPDFTDIQGYFTYDFNKDLQLGFIGNFNQAEYNFTPKERATALGLIDFSLRLSSVFEGREVDRFTNGLTGVSLTYVPERDHNPIFLKLLASNFLSDETERFDILGFYRLAQIETDLGSEEPGQEVAILGVGTQHNFARNFLFSRVSNIEQKGGIELQAEDTDEKSSSHFIQWGIKFQNEFIDDKLNEWERLDSAGYSLPFNESNVEVLSVFKSENEFNSNRYSAYLQDSYSMLKEDAYEFKVNLGARASYWNLNEELIVSPRAQLLYKPLGLKNDLSFKLAGGVYYQAPFYRELRRPDGSINSNLKSQKSIHIVGGMTYDFPWKNVSEQPFRLITEVYYKKLDNLVSYEIDNVKIRYSGENDSKGYITGLDLRINGEFVPGAESWLNLSFLKARESINDVQHFKQELGDSIVREQTYVPRPTDQLFSVALFFQDYLPKNENFKVNLKLVVGSGLPFGVKDNNTVFRNTYRYKAYRRVDIGFAWQLWNADWRQKKPQHPFRFANNAWLSLEVFNLLQIENVASNTWIKTIFDQQYAIPNNLTSRRINLKFRVDF
jgi:hypothetical protein